MPSFARVCCSRRRGPFVSMRSTRGSSAARAEVDSRRTSARIALQRAKSRQEPQRRRIASSTAPLIESSTVGSRGRRRDCAPDAPDVPAAYSIMQRALATSRSRFGRSRRRLQFGLQRVLSPDTESEKDSSAESDPELQLAGRMKGRKGRSDTRETEGGDPVAVETPEKRVLRERPRRSCRLGPSYVFPSFSRESPARVVSPQSGRSTAERGNRQGATKRRRGGAAEDHALSHEETAPPPRKVSARGRGKRPTFAVVKGEPPVEIESDSLCSDPGSALPQSCTQSPDPPSPPRDAERSFVTPTTREWCRLSSPGADGGCVASEAPLAEAPAPIPARDSAEALAAEARYALELFALFGENAERLLILQTWIRFGAFGSLAAAWLRLLEGTQAWGEKRPII